MRLLFLLALVLALFAFAGCAATPARPARPVAADAWDGWRDTFRAAVVAAGVPRCEGEACICRAVCDLKLPPLPDRSADVTLSIPTLGGDWRVDVLSEGIVEECRHADRFARICESGG